MPPAQRTTPRLTKVVVVDPKTGEYALDTFVGDVPTELLCREGAHALRSLSDLGIRSEVAAADFESVLEQERLEQQVETVSPFQMRAGVEQQELDFKRYHRYDADSLYASFGDARISLKFRRDDVIFGASGEGKS